MKLQVSSRLAIFAALELAADEGRQLSVADIGKKFGVSSHHLAKVMHVMGRAGLVRSVRGAGGGYQFTGKARRTTLLDIIRLFEDLSSVDRDGDIAESTAEGQALREVLEEVDEISRATLGSITVSTMRKIVERRQPRQRNARKTASPADSPARGRLSERGA